MHDAIRVNNSEKANVQHSTHLTLATAYEAHDFICLRACVTEQGSVGAAFGVLSALFFPEGMGFIC